MSTSSTTARRIPLEQVRVAEPCPVPWDSMAGDDKSRYCSHCKLHVHNLSALREDEAQRLVCESAGRLCIASVPNEQGGVTTLEYAETKRPRYGWKMVAALAAMSGVASAVTTVLYRAANPAPPPPIRGMMIAGEMLAPSASQPATACPGTEAAGEGKG